MRPDTLPPRIDPCTGCGKPFAASAWSMWFDKRTGAWYWRSRCDACLRAYGEIWRAHNPGYAARTQKAYRERRKMRVMDALKGRL